MLWMIPDVANIVHLRSSHTYGPTKAALLAVDPGFSGNKRHLNALALLVVVAFLSSVHIFNYHLLSLLLKFEVGLIKLENCLQRTPSRKKHGFSF